MHDGVNDRPSNSLEVLRCYDSSQANMPIVMVMVPRVMALKPRLAAAQAEEDDDVAQGLCRLFTEMGEAYMSLIASEQDFNQMTVRRACAARRASDGDRRSRPAPDARAALPEPSSSLPSSCRC